MKKKRKRQKEKKKKKTKFQQMAKTKKKVPVKHTQDFKQFVSCRLPTAADGQVMDRRHDDDDGSE